MYISIKRLKLFIVSTWIIIVDLDPTWILLFISHLNIYDM